MTPSSNSGAIKSVEEVLEQNESEASSTDELVQLGIANNLSAQNISSSSSSNNNKPSSSCNSLPRFPPKSSNPPLRRTIRFKVSDKFPSSRPKGRGRRKPTPFIQSTTSEITCTAGPDQESGSHSESLSDGIPQMNLAAMTDELRLRLRNLELDMCSYGLNQIDPNDTESSGSIDDFIIQHRGGGDIYFDTVSVTKSNGKICAVSSNGLTKGVYEWSTRIRRTDVSRCEIGVIGIDDMDSFGKINISDHGVQDTKALGARAVYGNVLAEDSTYYCSFNRDNSPRCFRQLAPSRSTGWTENDVITVVLNLTEGRIKFLLNGRKVRKSLSIQPDNAYHPCICFAGDCQYTLFLGPIASHRM